MKTQGNSIYFFFAALERIERPQIAENLPFDVYQLLQNGEISYLMEDEYEDIFSGMSSPCRAINC